VKEPKPQPVHDKQVKKQQETLCKHQVKIDELSQKQKVKEETKKRHEPAAVFDNSLLQCLQVEGIPLAWDESTCTNLLSQYGDVKKLTLALYPGSDTKIAMVTYKQVVMT